VKESLARVEAIFKKYNPAYPFEYTFVDVEFQKKFTNINMISQLASLFASLAVVITGLGLFGLAACTAEQRTKEIGIRKALGAGTGDVLRLLLWQFSKPVVWANLIAWPVAGWAMQRWLAGLMYHIDLPLWLFPLAALLALSIALITVGAHSLRVARTRPVTALRHE
jgi:predicted lysophospholipase L1 biosynthesis ABC-type transport system permease subunit